MNNPFTMFSIALHHSFSYTSSPHDRMCKNVPFWLITITKKNHRHVFYFSVGWLFISDQMRKLIIDEVIFKASYKFILLVRFTMNVIIICQSFKYTDIVESMINWKYFLQNGQWNNNPFDIFQLSFQSLDNLTTIH